MRILQFGRFYPPSFGGIENVMYEITTGLNDVGVECDVLCSNKKNKYEVTNNDTYSIFRTKSYGIYFSTSISPQMISKLKEIQDNYDVISVHFPDPMAALAIFLTRPKAKIVIHWHSDVIKQKYLLKLFEPLQNWVINRADLIIGATEKHIGSSDQKDRMLHKSEVIPYPFDLEALPKSIDQDILNSLKIDYKDKKIIFSMGRLVYYKGFEYLIKSAKYLSDEYVIIIGGIGKLEKSLNQLIIDNNLHDKVKLIGSIPYNELGSYYKFCDIFCLPSTYRSEMFGIVQLEAMSFGKPVVSTKIDRSGVCNVNINEVTGICIEVANSKEIARAITSIMNDENTYLKYSENSKKRVTDIFEKKTVISSYIKAYKNLLDIN